MLCKNPCLWFAAGLLALATLLGLLFGSGGGAGSSSTPDGNYSTILENDLPAGAKKPFITYANVSVPGMIGSPTSRIMLLIFDLSESACIVFAGAPMKTRSLASQSAAK